MTATFDRGIVLLMIGIVIGAFLFARPHDTDDDAATLPVPVVIDEVARERAAFGYGANGQPKRTGT